MSWLVAGVVAGVVAYLVDFVMWSKVFTKGMEPFATPPPPGQPVAMGGMMIKSAVLALVFGVLLAWLYARFRPSLWVEAGGALAGIEFAVVLWLPLALAQVGSGVWFDRARPLLNANMWAWLVRMSAAGLVVGLFIR